MNTRTINTAAINTPAQMADALRKLVARCEEIGGMEDMSCEIENAIANAAGIEAHLADQAAQHDHDKFETLRTYHGTGMLGARMLGG